MPGGPGPDPSVLATIRVAMRRGSTQFRMGRLKATLGPSDWNYNGATFESFRPFL